MDIVTLTGENGQSIDFYLEAELEYEGEAYQILVPKTKNMGLAEGDALVFHVEYIANDLSYSLVEDDDLLKEIEKIYNQGE